LKAEQHLEHAWKFFERYRKTSIIFFICVIVLIGVLLLLIATFCRGTLYEYVFASLGSTLIAVGLVEVVSEGFIRPGIIGRIRESFPLFATEPKAMPRDLLISRLTDFIRVLSPRPELEEGIVELFRAIFVDPLRETYRDDLRITLKLEKQSFNGNRLCKITAIAEYTVHNITKKEVKYETPFYSNTFSYTNKGIPIEDHIKLLKMTITEKGGAPIDLGAIYGLYSTVPVPKDPLKVELKLPVIPVFTIKPDSEITVYVEYSYLADLMDGHTQRVGGVTKNVKVRVDYQENDFFVDLDSFCMPPVNIVSFGHSYAWDGWFLPNHGFRVLWKPARR
jgi:hypothetical protein